MEKNYRIQIYDDDEFRKLVEKLNALYPALDRWKFTTARKAHEDEFGDSIQEGATYFKRQYDVAWDAVLKLSRNSMEMLLFCIFNGNFQLQKHCEELVKEEREKLAEEHEKHSPLKQVLGEDYKKFFNSH